MKDSPHDVGSFISLPNTKIIQRIQDSLPEVSVKFVICRRSPTCSQLMEGYLFLWYWQSWNDIS